MMLDDKPEYDITVEDIDKIIEDEQKKSIQLEKECYHKDIYSNPHDREINRLRTLRSFVKLTNHWEWYGNGTIILEDRIVYALCSGKWRNIYNNKWYLSKGAEDFYKRYLKGEK